MYDGNVFHRPNGQQAITTHEGAAAVTELVGTSMCIRMQAGCLHLPARHAMQMLSRTLLQIWRSCGHKRSSDSAAPWYVGPTIAGALHDLTRDLFFFFGDGMRFR